MRDAVALAWSGRLPEALSAAREQAGSDDPFLVGQGLEALAVLGEQHGVRSTPELDALLVKAASEGGPLSRRAFEAAWALGSKALQPVAARRFESGAVTWDLLRYVGEWPSLELARAFAEGWERVPPELLDEALLTTRVLPVASADEYRAWGERVTKATGDESDEVRRAAFVALWTWRPAFAADACAKALVDSVLEVRVAAAQALAVIDLDRLVDRAVELEDEYPEALRAVPLSAAMKLAEARKRRTD